ncbi:DgyrCDS9664 [Dimorphilus gyrociliatus]|uniref:DgyrCDS9663 n=1 Tax=Dimorphilus gyrociliatus TaxID=2664684 RepID=A0A7I8VXM2_9ANNE|nr:DgyrCDS9663 [Dimorphilus gyrociliatus]CAD5121124.1 DgyrCDS9664 [Dimorphilus gyrociliatus]
MKNSVVSTLLAHVINIYSSFRHEDRDRCDDDSSPCSSQQCVKDTDICNNERNCFDGSDELCLHKDALKPQFRKGCNDKQQYQCHYSCLPLSYVNDGKYDCDNDDETLGYRTQIQSTGKYCYFEKTSMGIPITDLFQRIEHCDRKKCENGYYRCRRDDYCISIEQVCDGIKQCAIGDDESDCGRCKACC